MVMAAAIWGKQWSGSHVCFHCDNMAVVAILGRRTAKTPSLTHLLWCLSFFSAIDSFHFSALHIPGVLNVAADALFRNRMTLFCSLVAQTQQFLISPALSALLLSTMPDWGSPSCSLAAWPRSRRIHSSIQCIRQETLPYVLYAIQFYTPPGQRDHTLLLCRLPCITIPVLPVD